MYPLHTHTNTPCTGHCVRIHSCSTVFRFFCKGKAGFRIQSSFSFFVVSRDFLLVDMFCAQSWRKRTKIPPMAFACHLFHRLAFMLSGTVFSGLKSMFNNTFHLPCIFKAKFQFVQDIWKQHKIDDVVLVLGKPSTLSRRHFIHSSHRKRQVAEHRKVASSLHIEQLNLGNFTEVCVNQTYVFQHL